MIDELDALLAQTNVTKNQLLMWLTQRRWPAARNYSMVKTYRLRGPLDVSRFERAFAAVVAAHDALRTVVVEADGLPRREVRDEAPRALEHVDLSTAPDPTAAWQAWCDERIARAFDLERSLYDAALVRLAADDVVFFLNQHHVGTDSWSVALVWRALRTAYETDAALPSAPRYEEVVEAQRTYRASKRAERAAEHWRTALAEPLPPLRFFGRAEDLRSHRSTRVEAPLGAARVRAMDALGAGTSLARFSRELGRTEVVVAWVATLLHRVCGVDHVGVGVPLHNRPRARDREVSGLVMELCPVRVRFDAHTSFDDVLRAVDRELGLGLRHYELGTGNPGGARAYHAIANVHNTSFEGLSGLAVEDRWVHSGHSDPLESVAVHVHDFAGTGEHGLLLDFDDAVFDDTRRDAFLHASLELLDGLLAAPGAPVAHVPLPALQEATRDDVEARLASWSPTRRRLLARRLVGPGRAERLVAYAMPRDPARFDADAALTELRAKLPESMVPSQLLAIDRWPAGPNGKIDVLALPSPEDRVRRNAHVPPATPLEELVARVWREEIGCEQVGRHDDFFELGGQSIVATRVVSRLGRELGIEVLLGALFRGPTVAELAAHVEARRVLVERPVLDEDEVEEWVI